MNGYVLADLFSNDITTTPNLCEAVFYLLGVYFVQQLLEEEQTSKSVIVNIILHIFEHHKVTRCSITKLPITGYSYKSGFPLSTANTGLVVLFLTLL